MRSQKVFLLVATFLESQICSTRGTTAIVCSILPILSIWVKSMHLEFPILQTLGVFYQTTERGRDPEKICKFDNFPFFWNSEMSRKGWEAQMQ